MATKRSEDCLSSPIVTIMLDTGLRVSELCGLDLDDIDFEDLSALVIGGKGEKDRTVLFTRSTVVAIEAWKPMRETRLKLCKRSEDQRSLFLSSRGNRMNPRSVQKIIDRLADAADIPRTRANGIANNAHTPVKNNVFFKRGTIRPTTSRDLSP